MNNTLYIIPARGGSKGVPNKNIKLLNGKPLIEYSIDYARQFTSDENICVSTDSDNIIQVVEKYDLEVKFKRPYELATDTATTNDVLIHALEYYNLKGVYYDKIVLLQPTSPFRKKEALDEAFKLYTDILDMVVSVKVTDANPYYVLFEENEIGYLGKSKEADVKRRQDVPEVYELNGSIYLINVKSLLEKKTISKFTKIKKVVMDNLHSTDIDTSVDWMYCEFLLEKNIINV